MGELDWPGEFERTDPSNREAYSGGFRVTRSVAFGNVLDELRGWDGVTDVQLDSGAEHQKRDPNKPYANASYDDPGVVVRFQKDGEDMAAACDRWDNPRDNAQDLYHACKNSAEPSPLNRNTRNSGSRAVTGRRRPPRRRLTRHSASRRTLTTPR